MIYTLHETEPGCFEFSSTVSLLPAWNMKNSIKVRPMVMMRRMRTRAGHESSLSWTFHGEGPYYDLLLVESVYI